MVELSEDSERASFRATLGIPEAVASCHTGVVDGYAIEGHVPSAAIQRLLANRPIAVGLALPGMPGDSPGMGGDEQTWLDQPVSLINRDGSISEFAY